MKRRFVTTIVLLAVLLVPSVGTYAAHVHNYSKHVYSGASYVSGKERHRHLDYYVNGVPYSHDCEIWNYSVNCYLVCGESNCGAKLDSSVHTHSVGASHHVLSSTSAN